MPKIAKKSKVIAIGGRIDEEIRRSIAENTEPDKPAKQMIIGECLGFSAAGRPPEVLRFRDASTRRAKLLSGCTFKRCGNDLAVERDWPGQSQNLITSANGA